MNHKSKKRLSILKKAVSSEESSPTFTKINRRISFCGKKSVKEFTSDDNKMTIWGNSYEESADMAQSSSHHTIAVDSTISHSMTSTTLGSEPKSEAGNKENEHINLRNRTILKRKSNVLKSIRIQPVNHQKEITPNMETVEMDISINENDSLSQKRLSVSEFLSPKKNGNSHLKNIVPDNLTPVPPPKISKFICPTEETIPKYLGRRISDESSSDSCMMATTYDGSNFSIPSRILDKGDINLTYGFNLSEFDILQSKPHRPSENVTSFATKIDQINFSNDDEPKKDDNSVLLQIKNPQIEQMRITGSIITDTDQNLNVSIEITDNSKVLDSLRSPAKPPPKPDSPKANPVLEMFKIRNQLKKQMSKRFEEQLQKEYFAPFIPAKFEPPLTKYLDSMNLCTNVGFELPKVKENTNRQTILFAKDSSDFCIPVEDDRRSTSQNVEVSGNGQKSKRATIQFQNDDIDTSIVGQKETTVNKNSARETICFPNQELETSMLNTTIANPIRTESTNRKTIYFPNNDLNLTGSTSFEHQIKEIENISRGTIPFPKQGFDTSTADEVINKGEQETQTKRGIVHSNQQLEMSLDESNANMPAEVSEKPGREPKRDTIYFRNHELDMSINTPVSNIEDEECMDLTKVANVNEEHETQIKRGTIYFQNEQLETSKVVVSLNKNSNAREGYEGKTKRATTYFVNEQLEISANELSPNLKDNYRNESLVEEAKVKESQKKRETIHFPNQELELSVIESSSSAKDDNKNSKTGLAVKVSENRDKQDVETTMEIVPNIKNMNMSEPVVINEEPTTKRGTIHFPNQELDMSTMEAALNVEGDNKNVKIQGKRNLKRGTIHFPSQELEISMMESDLKVKTNLSDQVKINETLTKRGTIHFPSEQLEMSTVESVNVISETRNPTKQRERETKRGTIHFMNQELETSMIESGTNPKLDMSTVEFYPDSKRENRNLNLTVKNDLDEKEERRTNRGTIHFPNQELEMSTMEAAPSVEGNNKNVKLLGMDKVNEKTKAQTKQETIQGKRNRKRGTINFPSQELDISMMESDLNVKSNIKNKSLSNSVKINETHTKRGTLHFSNQQLELSTVESDNVKKSEKRNPAKQRERGTDHTTTSIMESSANRKLDMFTVESYTDIISENRNQILSVKNDIEEKDERRTKRGTIHFLNQELETSTLTKSDTKNEKLLGLAKVNEHTAQTKQETTQENRNLRRVKNRGTINFPNQELEISAIEPAHTSKNEILEEMAKVDDGENAKNKESIQESRNLKRDTKRGTIHFPNQELDTSLMEYNINFSDPAKIGGEHKAHTKRDTVHFPNQQLEMSTVESYNARNENRSPTKEEERETKRKTIHFLNQQLESSMIESCPYVTSNDKNIKLTDSAKTTEEHNAHNQRGTLHYQPNEQLDISLEIYHDALSENGKMNLPGRTIADEKVESQAKRGTIYFPNQDLESSVVVESVNKNQNLLEAPKVYKEQENTNNRDTMYLSNQQKPIKRGTIYFPNQGLETSVINSNLDISSEEIDIRREPTQFENLDKIVEDLVDNVESNTSKRSINYFHDNNHLGTSIQANQQNKKQSGNLINSSLNDLNAGNSVNQHNQACAPGAALESIKRNATNRGTIYFKNEKLDASIVEDNEKEDDNIDVSMQELIGDDSVKYSQLGTIHFQSNDLDITNPRTPLACQLHKTDLGIIQPNSLVPGTTYFEDKTLDVSEFEKKNHNTTNHTDEDLNMSGIEPKSDITKQPSRSTIYFPNQGVDTTTAVEADQMDTSTIQSIKNVPTYAKPKFRDTIHYKNDNLEMSQISEDHRNKTDTLPRLMCWDMNDLTRDHKSSYRDTMNFKKQNSVDDRQNLETDAVQIDLSAINSETIHFDGTDLDKLDISDQLVPGDTDSVAYSLNPETRQCRVKALDEQISGQRKSVNNSRDIPDRAINLDCRDKTNTNAEYLNMSNDFDEKHIKQQSTMTMAHIVNFLSEKRKNGDYQEMSDMNLDNIEIDLSSYEKHEEQLANNLSSGLKLSGHDSTYFGNNTQALCNLDPKRIFCVSKYDAMNAATPQRSLLPVPRKKSVRSSCEPNISTHQLQDENTLHDIIPRFANETQQNNIQDFLEITANLVQQNKTRQEICNDYINLTISRFSSSFANSSNTEQIDQTNINLVNSFGDMEEEEQERIVSKRGLKYVAIEEADLVYQNVDKIFTRKRKTHVPVLDLTDCEELLNQPSFTDIANAYKLKNLKNLKRVSELHEPNAGPEKPSLRFLMNNYREQLKVEKPSLDVGIIPFLPLIPKITVLLQNKLAERKNYWACHDTYYNHGILMFTHHRVPCVQIKMMFEFFEETEFGELEFSSVVPMMSKTKIISSTFELIQHLQFFKRVPSEMKNACRRSNEILDFLDNLDSKIIKKNYEDIQKLKDIVVSTNSKIWHKNETGECGITKSIIHCRNIYDIVIKISDLQITDISDVTVKPRVLPTNKVAGLSRGLDFLQKLLEKPRDYFNFYE